MIRLLGVVVITQEDHYRFKIYEAIAKDNNIDILNDCANDQHEPIKATTPYGMIRHLSTEPNLDYWEVLHDNTYHYLSYESALTSGIAFATYNLKLIGSFL